MLGTGDTPASTAFPGDAIVEVDGLRGVRSLVRALKVQEAALRAHPCRELVSLRIRRIMAEPSSRAQVGDGAAFSEEEIALQRAIAESMDTPGVSPRSESTSASTSSSDFA